LVEMPTPEEFLCGGRFCHPSRYRRKSSLSSLHQNQKLIVTARAFTPGQSFFRGIRELPTKPPYINVISVEPLRVNTDFATSAARSSSPPLAPSKIGHRHGKCRSEANRRFRIFVLRIKRRRVYFGQRDGYTFQGLRPPKAISSA